VKEYGKKKAYNAPRLKKWGTVADLTRTGQDPIPDDMKEGTVGSMGV
jgi:hypothetical protein